MLHLFFWIVFGLIVGLLSKMLYPNDVPVGFMPTVLIGVGGSFVGGGINWLLNMGNEPFGTSGLLMSVVGGILCCAAWRWYNMQNAPDGPRTFLGRRI